MYFKHLLLPVIAVFLGSSLQGQTPDASPATSPSASPGVEEHEGGWHHHHGGWLFRKLNLTDDQRQKLEMYRTSNQGAFRSALSDYLKAKAQLENAISQNNQNLSGLSGYVSDLATKQTQLIQLRMQREAYLVSILTPEQKDIWNQIQSRKAARLQDRINELEQGQ